MRRRDRLNSDDQHGERDGQRDALADLEIVLTLARISAAHRGRRPARIRDVRVVRQTCDDPAGGGGGLVGGPTHMHEDQTGATVLAAQISSRTVPE